MTHNLLEISNLSFVLPHKNCFSNFSSIVTSNSRIAIIGNNGFGKSSLLKMINGLLHPSDGIIKKFANSAIGYVPQIIESEMHLSGGQRFNSALTDALILNPDLLLLDEPTNHLDSHNRLSLMRLLQKFSGALIVASHDTELLNNCIDTLWHIDKGKVHIFNGKYADYIYEMRAYKIAIEKELDQLNHQKKDMHKKLMQEQTRSANSKASGQQKIKNNKWTKMTADFMQSRAQKSQGSKLKNIDHKKQEIAERLNAISLPEIITPKFCINSDTATAKTIITISDGSIGYTPQITLIKEINLMVNSKDRIAILGANGSGKSTLIKSILQDDKIFKTGDWYLPKISDIGYLDQHYKTLYTDQTVLENIANTKTEWNQAAIRKHLNDFLFRRNEEVNLKVAMLSGGEKARLSLAKIAANTPKLLILDEITNNLDLQTKEHVVQVIKNFPAALLVISHDGDFLKAIDMHDFYLIENNNIKRV